MGCRIAKRRQRPRAAGLDYAQSCGEQVEVVRTLERTRSCGQVALNLADLQSLSSLQRNRHSLACLGSQALTNCKPCDGGTHLGKGLLHKSPNPKGLPPN